MKKILFVLTLCGLLPVGAHAAGIPTLDEIAVTAKSTDQLGVASTSSEGTVTAEQLENRPLLRPAEVLEVVPGLIISQHSGDGKANQYYLRGFNLDHGTDFATSLLGMPVNMPTHAHGQGYTDLNFLIPELVERVQYRKGTYYAGDGDFSAAGSARIDYVRKVDAPYAQVTMGGGGYSRLLAAASPQMVEGDLLLAADSYHNDGPWTVPEHLRKDNLVLRYGQGERDNGWNVALLGYDAKWTATDQIAQRAIGTVGSGGLRLRYFGPRPLVEDDSVRSKSSTLVNMLVGYRITRQVRLSMEILNLFGTRVSDIDYYYASQLPSEAAPVADVHTHPAEPRALRLTLKAML